MRRLATGLALAAALCGTPAAAACLTPAETRAALAHGEAQPLAQVIAQVQPHGRIIRVRLCRHAGSLVYRLTIMTPHGKVHSSLADARSGRFLSSE